MKTNYLQSFLFMPATIVTIFYMDKCHEILFNLYDKPK